MIRKLPRLQFPRLRLATFTLAVLLMVGGAVQDSSARAAEDPDAQRAQDAVDYFKRYAKSAKDLHAYGDLVAELGLTQHPLAVETIADELKRKKDLYAQMICADILGEFTKDEKARDAAGPALVEALFRRGYDREATDSILNSIGLLGWKPAVPRLCDFMQENTEPWLLLAGVRACGRLDDIYCLPTLLDLWFRHGKGFKWPGAEASVDTGTAGDGDQKAAEAKVKAEQKSNGFGKGKATSLHKVYMQELIRTCQMITKEKPEDMDEAVELHAWMKEREAQFTALGLSIPEVPKRMLDPDAK